MRIAYQATRKRLLSGPALRYRNRSVQNQKPFSLIAPLELLFHNLGRRRVRKTKCYGSCQFLPLVDQGHVPPNKLQKFYRIFTLILDHIS